MPIIRIMSKRKAVEVRGHLMKDGNKLHLPPFLALVRVRLNLIYLTTAPDVP